MFYKSLNPFWDLSSNPTVASTILTNSQSLLGFILTSTDLGKKLLSILSIPFGIYHYLDDDRYWGIEILSIPFGIYRASGIDQDQVLTISALNPFWDLSEEGFNLLEEKPQVPLNPFWDLSNSLQQILSALTNSSQSLLGFIK